MYARKFTKINLIDYLYQLISTTLTEFRIRFIIKITTSGHLKPLTNFEQFVLLVLHLLLSFFPKNMTSPTVPILSQLHTNIISIYYPKLQAILMIDLNQHQLVLQHQFFFAFSSNTSIPIIDLKVESTRSLFLTVQFLDCIVESGSVRLLKI